MHKPIYLHLDFQKIQNKPSAKIFGLVIPCCNSWEYDWEIEYMCSSLKSRIKDKKHLDQHDPLTSSNSLDLTENL